MALYLQLVKFTPAGADKVLRDGFEDRAKTVAKVVKSTGHGTLKGFWYIADADWHVASIIETDADTATLVQAQLQQTASGAIENVRVLRIMEAGDVEASTGTDFVTLREHLI
jgi:uncharacterized protein with GYD domain